MKLGPVTKHDKLTRQRQKMANSDQSRSWIPDAWSVTLTFLIVVTKKSQTQLSY